MKSSSSSSSSSNSRISWSHSAK